ncbi:MAG TPA: hypothetical protein VLK25_02820 [Allosphingosinicella sp.]|nr:hypothetical protein [Allosphingosinicella sp.]
MATIAETTLAPEPRPDHLSGTPRAHHIDRWIYVFTAATFIVIVLAGFVPSSIEKAAAVRAGARPPFPLVMHLHAILMGSFLLLLLAQTWLVAAGRSALHKRLGLASMLLAPAIVIVGFLLAYGNYQGIWAAATAGPPQVRAQMAPVVPQIENILLFQLRIGILFPLLLWIGLSARHAQPGLHKRMMILAVAVAIPAGIDRIPWLPTTLPASPLATDLWTLAAVSPMLLWDVIRNGYLHKAYWIWLALFLPAAALVNGLWDTAWWHGVAKVIMGVS